MRPYIRSSYKKAIKIIDSCTNQDHIEASRRYVNLFFKTHTTFEEKYSGIMEIRLAEESTAKAYQKLYRKLDMKEKSLK